MLRLVQEITTTVARGPVGPEQLAELTISVRAAVPRIQQTVLVTQPLSPGRYLCYKDQDHGFVIMVLAWAPGDRTPIHDHGVWGVEAVLRGSLKVTEFSDCETSPTALTSRVLAQGQVMHNLPPARDVHCVEHYSGEGALSLHVYGQAMTNNRSYVPGEGFKVCQLACKQLCLSDVCKQA